MDGDGQRTAMDNGWQRTTDGNGQWMATYDNYNKWQQCCRAVHVHELYGDGVQKRKMIYFLLLRVFIYLFIFFFFFFFFFFFQNY